MSVTTERLTFINDQGHELAARLDKPVGVTKAYALFAHCFTCTKDIFAANRIAKGLSEAGIAVLRFDFTGLGASEGEFANSNFSSNLQDLISAANHMREHFEAPKILIGHSLGGAAVLGVAQYIPEVLAVSTIGAPADPAHVIHNFGSSLDEIEEKGEAEVSLAGRPFRIQKQFIDDVSGQKLLNAVKNLNKALLIFHAPKDETVGIDNAGQIFQAAMHPKSFVSLDDADHLLTRHVDAAYVGDLISAWAGRYISTTDVKPTSKPKAVEGTVAVAETDIGKLSNVVVTGSGHVISADEPISVGGDDSGPTPYDFLLAALGTCKSMTMRMYAERKGYKLEHAEVRLSHDKIHAQDCEDCATTNGKIDQIKTEITLKGDLSDEERESIFKIAERCPVHRTMTNEIIIEAKLKK